MSYGIPREDLSLSERREYRAKAQEACIRKAIKLSYATTREGLDVRDIFPGTDMTNPAGAGYTNEVFITGAIPINTWTSVFDTGAVAQMDNRKVLVIYKIVNLTPMPNIRAVRFGLGPTRTSMLAWFHTEKDIQIQETPEVYMSEPVVYTEDQWMSIECYANPAVAVGERLGFVGFVAEPVGETLS